MRYAVGASVLILTISLAGCSGDKSPTAPSPASTAPTRVISVTGNLAFGEVRVGEERDADFTIANSGTSPLTVSGLSVTGGLAAHTTASWTSGQIPAGGSQRVSVRFAPTAAGNYSGTITVNADQTGGSNTIPISGTATMAAFAGTWSGTYVVERCDGTGSVQDILCSQNRGLYPPGSSLPIRMELQQNGSSVTGTVAFGQVIGTANGFVSGSGVLTLQGTGRGGGLTATITSWRTEVRGNQMEGNITYELTVTGAPGVGSVVARLGRVTR